MKGPTAYENRRAFDEGSDLNFVIEFSLYSDTEFRSEVSSGLEPFALLNTVPAGSRRQGEPIPAVVLRAHYHLAHDSKDTDWSRTADDSWHAAGLDEEIAGLVSLALGVRLRTGGQTREFRQGGDPLGLPREHSHVPPLLSQEKYALVLPRARQRHDLSDSTGLLNRYFQMEPPAAVALLRAARSYQAGIWLAEGDPEFAWLKLVSAVETIAVFWWRDEADPVTYLEAWDDEFAKRLLSAGGDSLVDYAAKRLLDVTRSTHKFLKFLDEFAPAPPVDRPDMHAQVDWDGIPKALSRIYTYRSKSLHSGKPFPGPLLAAPMRSGDVAAERPLGLGSAHGESVWTADDLPMHFHIFEHIVRHSILSWAEDSLAGND